MEMGIEDPGGEQFILEPSGRVRKQKGIRRRPGRVPVSCAECRRLKIRCNRQIPCEGCIKKGCAAICPDGSLVVDKGSRLVLANTEELHDEIDRLRVRLLEVEEELRAAKEASLSSSVCSSCRSDRTGSSPQTDPSMTDAGTPPCVSSQEPNKCSLPSEPDPSAMLEDESFVDAFGSLTIGPRGESKFFGKTARSEFLIHANIRRLAYNKEFPGLSREILDAATSFPQCYRRSIASEEHIQKELLQALPPLSEACRLCEIFLEHGKYMYFPLPREHVFDEIIPNVYRSGLPTIGATDHVSLLFIILAYATYVDPSVPAFHPVSEHYYMYSRVALNSVSPMRETTVAWVQAYAYQAQFAELKDFEGTSMQWIDISRAFKFGQSIGLHLKSSRWNLDEKMARRRTYLFWQLFVADAWMSFSAGRPPTMDLTYMEHDLPPIQTGEETTDENGNPRCDYHQCIVGFARMMRTVIMPTAFAAKSPCYTQILDLDRRIRELFIPVHLRPTCIQLDRETPFYLYIQRWSILSQRETILLHLHRGYFAQAIHDSPDEPLKHKYGLSTIAAYRSAYRLIKFLDEIYQESPFPIERMSLAWSHVLTASIVMCLLITRSRPSKITRSALEILDVSHSLFQRAAKTSPAASASLDIIQKLHELAHSALDDAPSKASPALHLSELDRLGGKTTLTSDPESPPAHISIAQDFTSQEQSLPVPDEQQFLASLPQNTHPTIMNDLMAFEGMAEPVHPPQSMFDFLPEPLPQADGSQAYMGGWDFDWNQYGMPQPADPGVQPGQENALILDSTWQSFVEQLGITQL